MSDGSALPRFKRAFIAELEALGVPNVSYQSPMQPDEMVGDDGSGLACWFGDDAACNTEVSVVAGPQIWIDETWSIPFRIQKLGVDTDDTQETVDQAACELLGDIYNAFADASFGLTTDADVQVFTALPVGANTWGGGVLPPNLRAGRFELSIELHARLVIGN